MKLLNTKTIATLLVAGAMSIGTASAMTKVETTPLNSIVGVSSSNLNVRVADGVATLFGTVENGSEKALAKSYVEKMAGVDKVIDLVILN